MQSLNFPQVSYPYIDADFKLKDSKDGGEMMEPRDTLGCCLGFTVFQSKMAGAPLTIEMETKDEVKEFKWPPFIFMLQLDGTLKWFEFYNTQWQDDQLLKDSRPIKVEERK